MTLNQMHVLVVAAPALASLLLREPTGAFPAAASTNASSCLVAASTQIELWVHALNKNPTKTILDCLQLLHTHS